MNNMRTFEGSKCPVPYSNNSWNGLISVIASWAYTSIMDPSKLNVS
jgi:hypothetical protein